MARSITDILWTGSARVRAWRGGDVRAVYYTVLAVVVVWGIIALRLAQPIVLLQIGANIAGVVFVIASLHLLYLNTRILPAALRPPMWRRVALVGMALFYGFFVVLVARSFLQPGASALAADLDAVAHVEQHRIHVARRAHARAGKHRPAAAALSGNSMLSAAMTPPGASLGCTSSKQGR